MQTICFKHTTRNENNSTKLLSRPSNFQIRALVSNFHNIHNCYSPVHFTRFTFFLNALGDIVKDKQFTYIRSSYSITIWQEKKRGVTCRRHMLVPQIAASVQTKHQPLQWNSGRVHRYTAPSGILQITALVIAII